MDKPYLMVRTSDNLILGCMVLDDPDAGPIVPQQPAPDGIVLVDDPAAGTFSRNGRSDTEVAHWTDGAVVWTEAASLDTLKSTKLAELAGAFSQRMAAIKAGYPEEEVSSWFKQEAEARAYTADSSASTPLLAAMASARSITVADLAARVISNADAWSATSGAIIGKRQAYEDAVNAASDAAAVAAIAWTD